MKEYEVWSEGYSATGEHSDATFHGKAEAENFDEACIKVMGDSLDKNSDGFYRRGSSRGNLPPGVERQKAIEKGGNYSIWACELFDNETDARKSFG